jgi:ribosomal protein S27AE
MTARKEKRPKVEQFSLGLAITDPDKARQQAARKTRKCLSCSNSFVSEWAGNRTCGRCKNTVSYDGISDFSLSTAAF